MSQPPAPSNRLNAPEQKSPPVASTRRSRRRDARATAVRHPADMEDTIGRYRGRALTRPHRPAVTRYVQVRTAFSRDSYGQLLLTEGR